MHIETDSRNVFLTSQPSYVGNTKLAVRNSVLPSLNRLYTYQKLYWLALSAGTVTENLGSENKQSKKSSLVIDISYKGVQIEIILQYVCGK